MRAFPVWLRESPVGSPRWHWIPRPLRKAGRATARWIRGPDPPRDLLFTPLFPKFQELPVRFFNTVAPRRPYKVAWLFLLYAAWFVIWFVVLVKSASSGSIEDYGRPEPISCTASYWYVEIYLASCLSVLVYIC